MAPFAAHAQQPAMPLQISDFSTLVRKSPHRFSLPSAKVWVKPVTSKIRECHHRRPRPGRTMLLDRLPELAADLVRRRVAVIATPGSYQAALAAKAATATIPIVFRQRRGPDRRAASSGASTGRVATSAVKLPCRRSWRRSNLGFCMSCCQEPHGLPCWLILDNPVVTGSAIAELQAAASFIGVQIKVIRASSNDEIDAAFATVSEERIEGLLVIPGPLFGNRRVQITTLAARHAIPAMFYDREFAEAGGLISYGTSPCRPVSPDRHLHRPCSQG